MALFHLSVTQTKRSAGQSAIASAAYRAGERLYSEYYGEYSDYTRNCYSSTDEDTIVTAIIKDKYTISPNCETCPTPCGNTSNYDMTKFLQNHELKTIKEDLIAETVKLVIRLNKSGKTELPEEIYKAISFFGYELSLDSYTDLINSLNQMEV